MSRYIFFLLTVALLFLISCGGSVSPQVVNVSQPTVPPPTAGTGAVTGQALTNDTKSPITKTPIYLAEIHWDNDHKGAAYVLNMAQSPATLTDTNGFFTFNGVPPNEYALIVGRYDGNNDVVREGNGDARIYRIEAGKIVDTGSIQVNAIVQDKTQ